MWSDELSECHDYGSIYGGLGTGDFIVGEKIIVLKGDGATRVSNLLYDFWVHSIVDYTFDGSQVNEGKLLLTCTNPGI